VKSVSNTQHFRDGERYANTLRGRGGARRFLRFLGRLPVEFIIDMGNEYANRYPDRYAAWLTKERLVYDNKLPGS